MDEARIGVYVCHCGSNIAATVDVAAAAKFAGTLPGVVVSRHESFMCSKPGQERIQKDIEKSQLNRVVVAACSPQMHELTFRRACEQAGLNGYLCQVANIREQCSWIHQDRAQATTKAEALLAAAVRRVALHQPLETSYAALNPATMVVGGGIAGIQAALELAQAGHPVILVERESTIGGKMAKFDKTFPTLDCSACILTPKMVQLTHRPNVRLLTMTDVEKVSGSFGDFTVTVRKRARYVTADCTACGACTKVCPVDVPSPFDEMLGQRTAIYRTFAQAIPATYVIEKSARPPCSAACGVNLSPAGFVGLVKKHKIKEAARLLRLGNPLANVCPRMCHHACELECNRALVDQSIAIRDLERYVMDWARAHQAKIKPPKVARREAKVAVVGSGCAGLMCAGDLALKGYGVTVFDRGEHPGGQLIAVPAFRMPPEVLAADIEWLTALGVEFRTGVALGREITLESLHEQYGAVFLATGLNRPSRLGVPGEALNGVLTGIDYLRAINLKTDGHVRARVVVVGGDDVAVDAARSARRQGASVTMVFGRHRAEMPANPDDIAEAEAEGVQLRCLTKVIEIVGPDLVRGVRLMDLVLTQSDATGHRAPTPATGSARLLPCDSVIVAIGESAEPGLEPVADRETRQTSVPWVFAANLAAAGPTATLRAMSVGRRAAEAIHKYLEGEALTGFTSRLIGVHRPRDAAPRPHPYAPLYRDTPKAARITPERRVAQERARDFAEVAATYDDGAALAEASRCLSCGVCVECQECTRVCEPEAVRHEMQDEIEDVKVGQVLLATGYRQFDARRITQYGYGRLPDVVTGLEFERLLNSAGPTGGKVVCKDGRTPRAIAILHCVGSRHEDYHRYCSRVCCMYALKFAHLVRDRTDAHVYQLYIDMRAYGKGFEEFYGRVLEEGANVIRGRAAEVVEARGPLAEHGSLVVRTEDTLIGVFREIPVDMVVLCAAIEPQADAEHVKQMFTISMSPDGFFLERHPKLDPTATFTDGVFIAGACQGPKDIPDTVAQAGSAAARMMGNIALGKVAIDPVRATIDDARCSGCRICNNLCPYYAIEFLAERQVSRVNTALCKGCGTCVAACPAGAIAGTGFTDAQILAELEGLFAVA